MLSATKKLENVKRKKSKMLNAKTGNEAGRLEKLENVKRKKSRMLNTRTGKS